MPSQVKTVGLCASSTLQRYTADILEKGLRGCGAIISAAAPKIPTIYQVHGSPAAVEGDRSTVQAIDTHLRYPGAAPLIVLIHRPAEVQKQAPNLAAVLNESAVPFGLCFLGDLHIDDEFYDSLFAIRRVIPHGFYSASLPQVTPPYWIGAHTRWGELRSVEDSLSLLAQVLLRTDSSQLRGYLGGEPSECLSIDTITAALARMQDPRRSSKLAAVTVARWTGEDAARLGNAPTIWIGQPGIAPPPLHFNVQLFHHDGQIRTDENSGSLHSAPSIPVVVEMNGAERTEDLAVIKILKGATSRVSDCDFSRAADAIVDVVSHDEVPGLLRHNHQRAVAQSPQAIAQQYLDLFEELGAE